MIIYLYWFLYKNCTKIEFIGLSFFGCWAACFKTVMCPIEPLRELKCRTKPFVPHLPRKICTYVWTLQVNYNYIDMVLFFLLWSKISFVASMVPILKMSKNTKIEFKARLRD